MTAVQSPLRFRQNVFYSAVVSVQEAARNSDGVLPYLGKELETHGKQADTTTIVECEGAVQQLINAGSTDADLVALGKALQGPDAARRLDNLNAKSQLDPNGGQSPAAALAHYLVTTPSGSISEEASQASTSHPSPTHAPERSQADAEFSRDSSDAHVRMPVADSGAAKTTAVAMGVLLVAYVAVRFYDIADLQSREGDGGRTFYRICVALVELLFGATAVIAAASRMRKPAVLPQSVSDNMDRSFTPADMLTVLMVSDEDDDTIVASVESHYEAVKPEANAYRVVLCAQTMSSAVESALSRLSERYPSLLCFDYQSLADQTWLLEVQSTQPLAAKNLIVAAHMGMGQALFYTLDRLQLQYGHVVNAAAVCVMDGSSVVDREHYYSYATTALQRAGVAVVNTPTYARNRPTTGDFLDVAGQLDERVFLPGALADHKCAIGVRAFMARGYSLVRMLRRMELENVDSNSLDWAMYCMHTEARQATLALYVPNAPVTSVLAHTHSATIISTALAHGSEAFDVHAIFSREKAFISWEPFNPLGSPHHAARMAAVMELTLVLVVIISSAGTIAPWSTDSIYVAAVFLVHYGLMMFGSVVTAYGTRWSLAFAAMRNRVLAPLNLWLYFVDLSRFGVDRRGHFKVAGETTTADLIDYKEKQRAEQDESKAKAAKKAVTDKEKAAAERAAAKEAKQREAALKAKRTEDEKAQRKQEKELKKMQAAADEARKRRQHRGPGPVGLAEGVDHDGPLECPSLTFSASEPSRDLDVSPASAPASCEEGTFAIAEGLFRKKAAQDGNEPKMNLATAEQRKVVRQRVQEVARAEYKVPKTSAGKRTGKGSLLRPYPRIRTVGYAVAVVFALVALVSIYFSYFRLIGPGVPDNYTMTEVLLARSWHLSTVFLAVFLLIPAAVLLTHAARVPGALTNRPVGTVLLVLAILCVLVIGALPFASFALISSRNSLYDIREMHAKHMTFMAAMRSGVPSGLTVPWRAASDVGVRNPTNQADLSGGWYTGPGLAKFTYPQALAVLDLSLAAIAYFDELKSMPSAAPSGPSAVLDPTLSTRTALDDVREAILHGVQYLLACHDPTTNSVVSHVFDQLPGGVGGQWTRPEAVAPGGRVVRTVDGARPGTETFATVSAAFAAASAALTPFPQDFELYNELRARAVRLYERMRTTSGSYETAYPEVRPFWPSRADSLSDDQLLAAGMLLYMTGEQQYRNNVNGYFTRAQQERAALSPDLERFAFDVDDHWWTANMFLSMGDSINTRYSENMRRFVEAWTRASDDPNELGVVNSLVHAVPRWWSQQDSFITPGPLGLNARAMAYVVLYSSNQRREGDFERDAVCFAFGQLRNMVGLNADKRSFMVGYAPDGATSPRRPSERASSCPPDPSAGCGAEAFSAGSPNPSLLSGALVHGPSASGAYSDSRSAAANNGVSILNNSPLSILLAGFESRGLNLEDCIGLNPKPKMLKSNAVKQFAPAAIA